MYLLGDDHARDGGLSRHTAFDQSWFGWCLYDPSLTGSAGILRTPRDDETELSRHDIQPFADTFTDDVAFSPAATDHIGCDHFFDAWEMFG